jgi:uncharacterized BrkB/YihY/UPF0761 family membrane protein
LNPATFTYFGGNRAPLDEKKSFCLFISNFRTKENRLWRFRPERDFIPMSGLLMPTFLLLVSSVLLLLPFLLLLLLLLSLPFLLLLLLLLSLVDLHCCCYCLLLLLLLSLPSLLLLLQLPSL